MNQTMHRDKETFEQILKIFLEGTPAEIKEAKKYIDMNLPRPHGRGIPLLKQRSCLPCINLPLVFNIAFDDFGIYSDGRYKVSI